MVQRSKGELAREREVYRYASYILSECTPLPADHRPLAASSDTTLTALAQLAAVQTGCERAFISVLDSTHQYFIAEATPALPVIPTLQSDDASPHLRLWLSGTAIPRNQGICEHALVSPNDTRPNDELPLTLSTDTAADARFRDRPVCIPELRGQFYAAVPIRSNRNIDIGVLCVINPPVANPSEPAWDSVRTETIRNLSKAIEKYLHTCQITGAFRRSERMTRGVGSFMEEKTTLSGWQGGPNPGAYFTMPNREGALNHEQQRFEAGRELARSHSMDQSVTSPPVPSPNVTSLDYANGAQPEESSSSEMSFSRVFSRAANIIRESVEVEGCVFMDANSHGLEASASSTRESAESTLPDTSSGSGPSSGDETRQRPDNAQRCQVIGFSTSDTSSIDAASGHAPLNIDMPERFLSALLRRYPEGKIFSFNQHGEQHSSDSGDHQTNDLTPEEEVDQARIELSTSTAEPRPVRHPWTRRREGENILKAFPGARSVAFVPVREPQRKAWHAGAFIWTRTATRFFSMESELSYLRAFGTLAAAEMMWLKLALDDKSKADALSSISHELRSPLHGIILGAQLLQETELTVAQGDIVHTLETCGKTLSDTLDHLLDFSKINQFKLEKRKRGPEGSDDGQKSADGSRATHGGVQSLSRVVNLSQLVEEVVESVFAGFTQQRLTATKATGASKPGKTRDENTNGSRKQATAETFLADGDPFKNVMVLISVDPNISWAFRTQPGAVRRIVMNLFANSLKYTKSGSIHISIDQRSQSTNPNHDRTVVFTVADTGSGIGKDFLRNGVFRPFSQENYLLPGTGLGLSIVKRTVMQLRGRVSIHSRKGAGTIVTVSLPMTPIVSSPREGLHPLDEAGDAETAQARAELKGLRIFVSGFVGTGLSAANIGGGTNSSSSDSSKSPIERICQEWLNMTVVSQSQIQELSPDLILTSVDEFERSGREKVVADTPYVVVCPNIFLAQKHQLAKGQGGSAKIAEYVSQPFGPHKLARMLTLAFKRWTEAHAGPSDGSSHDPDDAEGEAKEPHQSESNLSCTSDHPLSPRPQKPGLVRRGSSYTSSAPKVLLVDDNPINIKLISGVMRKLRQGYSTATDGQAAVDAFVASPGKCRFIIMDVSMPVLDGFEATRLIRKHEHAHGLEPSVIIGLSGLASAEAHAEALRCGMDVFQTKPVNFRNLQTLLQSRGLLA